MVNEAIIFILQQNNVTYEKNKINVTYLTQSWIAGVGIVYGVKSPRVNRTMQLILSDFEQSVAQIVSNPYWNGNISDRTINWTISRVGIFFNGEVILTTGGGATIVTTATTSSATTTTDESIPTPSKTESDVILDAITLSLLVTSIAVGSISVILVISTFMYHNYIFYIRGSDRPKYGTILYVFRNIQDLYSDIIFAFYLFYVKHYLWPFAAIFTVVPYITSNVVGGYYLLKIFEWKPGTRHHQAGISQDKRVASVSPTMSAEVSVSDFDGMSQSTSIVSDSIVISTQKRLVTEYFNKYHAFFIVLSLLAGFYATIEFVSSKIFFLSMFNLTISKEHEEKIHSLRFYNVVLAENAIQIVIQIMYIVDVGSFEFIVFLSMVFSVLSLLFGIADHISQYNKKHFSLMSIKKAYRKQNAYLMEVQMKFHKSNVQNNKRMNTYYFQFSNAFWHKHISRMLQIEKHNVFVYYIVSNRIKNGIIICFEINNVDMDADFDDVCLKVSDWSNVSNTLNRALIGEIRKGFANGNRKVKIQIVSVRQVSSGGRFSGAVELPPMKSSTFSPPVAFTHDGA